MTEETSRSSDEQIPSYRPPRKPHPILAGTSAHRFPELQQPRALLDRLRVHHLDLAQRMLEADNGNLYLLDLLLMTMMQRSYGLVEAVIDCVDAYNLAAAAPLLRLDRKSVV